MHRKTNLPPTGAAAFAKFVLLLTLLGWKARHQTSLLLCSLVGPNGVYHFYVESLLCRARMRSPAWVVVSAEAKSIGRQHHLGTSNPAHLKDTKFSLIDETWCLLCGVRGVGGVRKDCPGCTRGPGHAQLGPTAACLVPRSARHPRRCYRAHHTTPNTQHDTLATRTCHAVRLALPKAAPPAGPLPVAQATQMPRRSLTPSASASAQLAAPATSAHGQALPAP